MNKSLTPEQYWKWRHKIEQMQHDETKLKNSTSLASLMDKDIEIQRLKLMVYKLQVLKNKEEKLKDSKKEYEDMKKDLEDSLGQSLNNCTINDETYEVNQLES